MSSKAHEITGTLVQLGLMQADGHGGVEPAGAQLSVDGNGNTVLVGADGVVAFRSVGAYAWADRPAAAGNEGVIIRITDIGGSYGSRWISDGSWWVPESGRVVLGKGETSLSCSGVAGTAETLATVLVPASSLGAKGRIVVRSSWNLTGNNAAKNIKHNYDSYAWFATSEAANANPRSARFETMFQNRNDAASQISSTSQGSALMATFVGAALMAGTINSLLDKNITIQGSRANAGDTCVLEAYMVELIVP